MKLVSSGLIIRVIWEGNFISSAYLTVFCVLEHSRVATDVSKHLSLVFIVDERLLRETVDMVSRAWLAVPAYAP